MVKRHGKSDGVDLNYCHSKLAAPEMHEAQLGTEAKPN